MILQLFQRISQKIFLCGFKNQFLELLKLSLPLVLTSYSSFLIPFVSIIFCGHIGDDELDAASLANNLIDLLGISIITGLSSACDTLLPQYYGSSNKKAVGVGVQKGLIITVLGSLLSMSLLFNAKHFMRYLNPDENIVQLADTYIIIYLPSFIFNAVGNVLIRYLQSQNIAYPVLIITFALNVLNCVLHAIFIFVFNMGISGAAISCTITNILQPFVAIAYIYYSKVYEKTWGGWTIKCLLGWVSYYKLAIPAFVMLLLEWVCFECGTFLSGYLGELYLGAQSIGQQIIVFCYMVPFGISSAGCIIIGQYLGSKRPEEARNALKITMATCGMFILVLVAVLISSHSFIPWAFTNDIEIKTLASNVVLVLALVHIFDATQTAFSSMLRAVGAQLYGALSNFVGLYIVALPVGISLMFETSLKIYGFWTGIVVGDIFLIVMQVTYILKLNWGNLSETAVDRAENEEKCDSGFLDEDEVQLEMEDVVDYIETETKLESFEYKYSKRRLYLQKILFIIINLVVVGILASTRYIIPDAPMKLSANETSEFNQTTLHPTQTTFFHIKSKF